MKSALIGLALVVALATASIPSNFDSRTNWKNCGFFILNQGQCGSCWDFCSVESFADRLCINGEAPSGTIISPEPILDCSKDNCGGGYPKTAWDWIIDNNGDTTCTHECQEGCSPYLSGNGNSPKCGNQASTCKNGDKWSQIYQAGSFESLSSLMNHNLTLYQDQMMNYGPLQACFTVYSNFYTYFDIHPKGIYSSASGSNVGGHCVKMIGWGTEGKQDYWLFANSWGPDWADSGYFKMARGDNLCGIEGQVSQGFTLGQSRALAKPRGIHPNVKETEMWVGGWTRQNNPAEEEIVSAAIAGLKELSAKSGLGLSLVSVMQAETQVVAGVNYKLVVKTEQGEVVKMKVYRDLSSEFTLVDHEIFDE